MVHIYHQYASENIGAKLQEIESELHENQKLIDSLKKTVAEAEAIPGGEEIKEKYRQQPAAKPQAKHPDVSWFAIF